jgi:hypothetical protein
MKHYNDMKEIKVKKLADKWEATHLPTRLTYRHSEKFQAIFELGKLVAKQMEIKFENLIRGKKCA